MIVELLSSFLLKRQKCRQKSLGVGLFLLQIFDPAGVRGG